MEKGEVHVDVERGELITPNVIEVKSKA